MPKMQFIGRALPSAALVTIQGGTGVNWEEADLGLKMTFIIKVDRSAVHVECETNRFLPDDFIHVYMRAFDLSRAAVDLVSFATGTALSVVLETWINPDGVISQLVSIDPNLAPLVTAVSMEPERQQEFNEVSKLVLNRAAAIHGAQ